MLKNILCHCFTKKKKKKMCRHYKMRLQESEEYNIQVYMFILYIRYILNILYQPKPYLPNKIQYGNDITKIIYYSNDITMRINMKIKIIIRKNSYQTKIGIVLNIKHKIHTYQGGLLLKESGCNRAAKRKFLMFKKKQMIFVLFITFRIFSITAHPNAYTYLNTYYFTDRSKYKKCFY